MKPCLAEILFHIAVSRDSDAREVQMECLRAGIDEWEIRVLRESSKLVTSDFERSADQWSDVHIPLPFRTILTPMDQVSTIVRIAGEARHMGLTRQQFANLLIARGLELAIYCPIVAS